MTYKEYKGDGGDVELNDKDILIANYRLNYIDVADGNNEKVIESRHNIKELIAPPPAPAPALPGALP